jgi:hypothetical protein
MNVGRIFCDLAKAFDCVNYIFMAFKKQFLTGSEPILQTGNKTNEIRSSNATQNLFSNWGTLKYEFTKGQF